MNKRELEKLRKKQCEFEKLLTYFTNKISSDVITDGFKSIRGNLIMFLHNSRSIEGK